MICEKCGAQISDKAKFCFKCGAKLEEKSVKAENAAKEQQVQETQGAQETQWSQGAQETQWSQENQQQQWSQNGAYQQPYQNVNHYYQNVQSSEFNYGGPNRLGSDGRSYKPIGMWGYFGYSILFLIPLVGFILLIVFALGGTRNINLRNFARSRFCVFILVLIMIIIIAATGGLALTLGR